MVGDNFISVNYIKNINGYTSEILSENPDYSISVIPRQANIIESTQDEATGGFIYKIMHAQE